MISNAYCTTPFALSRSPRTTVPVIAENHIHLISLSGAIKAETAV